MEEGSKVKTEEQIKSKLSNCKRELLRFENEYEKKPQQKWLSYINKLRGNIEMLRWTLDYQ